MVLTLARRFAREADPSRSAVVGLGTEDGAETEAEAEDMPADVTFMDDEEAIPAVEAERSFGTGG